MDGAEKAMKRPMPFSFHVVAEYFSAVFESTVLLCLMPAFFLFFFETLFSFPSASVWMPLRLILFFCVPSRWTLSRMRTSHRHCHPPHKLKSI